MSAEKTAPVHSLTLESGVSVSLTSARGESGGRLRWKTRCDKHGAESPLMTLSRAAAAFPDPQIWCSCCREEASSNGK